MQSHQYTVLYTYKLYIYRTRVDINGVFPVWHMLYIPQPVCTVYTSKNKEIFQIKINNINILNNLDFFTPFF